MRNKEGIVKYIMKSTKGKMLVILGIVMALGMMSALPEANAQERDVTARIELEQSGYTVKAWRSDGSHLAALKGRLTYGDHPVANALLETETGGRSIRTGEDGSFELNIDRSLIAYKPVRVVSLQEARIDGKPIPNQIATVILSASSAISVYHPIVVSDVEPLDKDGSKVKVHARMMSEEEDIISFFQVSKYRIAGQVADADGKPVKNAVVWIDRDNGEGFAKSTPADKDGRYEMYYWPEEEDTKLTVLLGAKQYTLPEGKVLLLPQNTSVDIRIQLPREGSVIDDKPPALTCLTSKGATYSGLLPGLDVPAGISYSLTIPDKDGRFSMIVPKEVWETHPLFFETKLTKFLDREKVLRAGDELPIDFVQPSNKDPRITASTS